MTSSLYPSRRSRLTSSLAVGCERKSADADPPPVDAEQMRREILVRLMRLHCERKGGCTRRCRRAGRCVAADAVAAEAAAKVSCRQKGPPGGHKI
jgi:hypothetical protein